MATTLAPLETLVFARKGLRCINSVAAMAPRVARVERGFETDPRRQIDDWHQWLARTLRGLRGFFAYVRMKRVAGLLAALSMKNIFGCKPKTLATLARLQEVIEENREKGCEGLFQTLAQPSQPSQGTES